MSTGSGVSVWLMDRFAVGLTVVAAEAVLLTGLRSIASEPTVAELASGVVPGAGGGRGSGGAAPTARLLRVQITSPPEALQLQPESDAPRYVAPAGSVSVTATLFARLGPALVMSRV